MDTIPHYAYDESKSPAHNLIRACLWVAENVREPNKRLHAAIKCAQAQFPVPTEDVVREGVYGQLLIAAVASWANAEQEAGRQCNYDAALSMLRKWRRRWDPGTGADDTDPGHTLAMLEWTQMKQKKYHYLPFRFRL